jgi:hypothetical protein
MAVVEVYGGAVVQACGNGVTKVIELKTLMELDTKTSNSTRRCRHKINGAN